MDERQVEIEGKTYIFDGKGWYESRTFMEPPDGLLNRLHSLYGTGPGQGPVRTRSARPAKPAAGSRRRGSSSARSIALAAAASRSVEPAGPPIETFDGDHAFLASDFPATVHLDRQPYPSAQAAFDEARRLHELRRPGSRRDWERQRANLMERCLGSKFADPQLRSRLLETQNRALIFKGPGADPFWGIVDGAGENALGQLLMKLRERLARHYCTLDDDQIAQDLRYYAEENRLIADEALIADCCWQKISALRAVDDEIAAPAWTAICARRQRLLDAAADGAL